MAAVVGVIANLAIFFAIHTLFREVSTFTWGPVDLQVPRPDSLKPLSLAVAAFAALLSFCAHMVSPADPRRLRAGRPRRRDP